MTTQNIVPVSGANTAIDLNKVHFFKPVAGKTLREQLAGMKLAGPEVVDHMRSLKTEEQFAALPDHWEKPIGDANYGGKWIYGFSLLYVAKIQGDERNPESIEDFTHGFVWTNKYLRDEGNHVAWHFRPVVNDRVLDTVVDGQNGWFAEDWILVVEDDEPQ